MPKCLFTLDKAWAVSKRSDGSPYHGAAGASRISACVAMLCAGIALSVGNLTVPHEMHFSKLSHFYVVVCLSYRLRGECGDLVSLRFLLPEPTKPIHPAVLGVISFSAMTQNQFCSFPMAIRVTVWVGVNWPYVSPEKAKFQFEEVVVFQCVDRSCNKPSIRAAHFTEEL